ncbi:peptidoglycan-binding domain-containing protein [Streptomyces abikoensis]|uniref:peptidoglycan-binding domain-containing protein n=1 Tax=Streptomyces abikoensis TaxID=97398 RepID=UPI0033F01EFB
MLTRAKAAAGLTAAGLVLGLTGTLVGATTATAAPAQQAHTRTVTIQAVNNLGLSTSEGKSVQCYVRDAGFDPKTIDGQLGSNSWIAWQNFLNSRGFPAGTADGIVGPKTISGLQSFLVKLGYDTGGVDGVAGPKTREAWKQFSHLGQGGDGSWC